jgi:predicted ATPase/class 3 adenylate cyclase
LPTGTITFLFTDIEGSTRLWEAHPEEMRRALARHEALIRHAIGAHGGQVFKTIGDAFCAAFPTAPPAVAAAWEAQHSLHGEPWDAACPIRVRMALHTGAAESRDGDYFGPPLNRVARLLEAGHGGQILLSLATQELARDHLPEGAGLRDLGEHRLKDLSRPEHVFQLVAPALPADFPPLSTLDARPNNLPAQPTPLIGREVEVGKAIRILSGDEVRQLTLTGPGGTGKTRLGLQVAAGLLDSFPDGVFSVPLAPISDPDLVASSIAQLFGLQDAGSRPLVETLEEYLRPKGLLLLLDNFEQVLPAAPLVARLLESCPRLKVLVTSRAALRLRWETEFPVSPLAVPDPKQLLPPETLSQYAAVALFIQRAVAVKPDFAVNNENAPAVAEICHRLDGLPLAIELAAVRTKLFSPQALLSRLERRLPLLVGGARDLPARQQTLRGAIAWSYDLLDEGEKALFRRLGVFVGGFTLEAAEAVCSIEGATEVDALDGTSALVERSLLLAEESSIGAPRFRMLETIREYAREQLDASGEAEAVRRRHAHYYREQAEAQESWAHGWHEMEHDNLRAALDWAVEREEVETGLRLALALEGFWGTQGHLTEARRRLAHLVVSLPSATAYDELRARTLWTSGVYALHQGDYTGARDWLERSATIYRERGDQQGLGTVMWMLGRLAHEQGNYAGTGAAFEEFRALSESLGDRAGIGIALNELGALSHSLGDATAARPLCERSVEILREAGNWHALAESLDRLGRVLTASGDPVAAHDLHEEGLKLQREHGDNHCAAVSLRDLGRAAGARGDDRSAVGYYIESLNLRRWLGEMRGIAECFEGLASVACARGAPERAARLFGAGEAIREAIGAPMAPCDRAGYARSAEALRAQLGEEAFAAAWQAGRGMPLEDAIALALAERGDDPPAC